MYMEVSFGVMYIYTTVYNPNISLSVTRDPPLMTLPTVNWGGGVQS
jgi:hypothetical protein